MALSYEVLKNADKANELYRELIKENTKKPDVYIKIFAANQAAKQTDKAINVLKRGVKNLPENAQLKALLGSTYLQAGQKEEAEKIIQSLLALGEKKEVFNYVGDIYRDASDIAKAEEYYNKSLALEPAQSEAYFGLASTYFNKGIDVLKEADKVPLDDMTGAYDKLKNESFDYFRKAIPNYRKVLETKPKDFQTLKALRNIYSLLNMKAEFQEIDALLKQQ
jgi:tetratricopeptide (TPR) repeat protein